MSFFIEPQGYEKNILSDLQSAWQVLRQSAADFENLECAPKILFHINEAMSWETIRHLDTMKPMLILIRNIAVQGTVPVSIMDEIEDITEILDEVLTSHKRNQL